MFTSSKEIMLVEEEVEDTPEAELKASEGAKTHNAEIARAADYTVSDKGNGWKFNNPDGKWSEQSFLTEAAAWEAAYADHNPTR
jgi:hypothetical protein